jgi:hypothetical protein
MSRPAAYSTGIVTVAAISDGTRTASSPSPRTRTVHHSTM